MSYLRLKLNCLSITFRVSFSRSNLARYDTIRYGAEVGCAHMLRETPGKISSMRGIFAFVWQVTRSEGLGPEVKRRILMVSPHFSCIRHVT